MCNGNTADLHDYSVSPHLIPGCIGYPTKIPGRTRIQSVLNVIGFGHAMSPTRSISCRARTQAAGYPRKVGIVSDEALNPTRPTRVATLVFVEAPDAETRSALDISCVEAPFAGFISAMEGVATFVRLDSPVLDIAFNRVLFTGIFKVVKGVEGGSYTKGRCRRIHYACFDDGWVEIHDDY